MIPLCPRTTSLSQLFGMLQRCALRCLSNPPTSRSSRVFQVLVFSVTRWPSAPITRWPATLWYSFCLRPKNNFYFPFLRATPDAWSFLGQPSALSGWTTTGGKRIKLQHGRTTQKMPKFITWLWHRVFGAGSEVIFFPKIFKWLIWNKRSVALQFDHEIPHFAELQRVWQKGVQPWGN